MKPLKNQTSLSWILLTALAVTWGSSFILMKRAMFSTDGSLRISSADVAALRMVIASTAFLPFIIKGFWSRIRSHGTPLFLVGLLGNGIPAFLFTAAQSDLDSSMAGILNALTPLFTLLIAITWYRKKYTIFNYAGIILALAGAVLLIFEHSFGVSGAPMRAYAMVVAATFCYAISVNLIRNKLQSIDSVQLAGTAMFFIGPWCLAYLVYNGFFSEVLQNPAAQNGLPYVVILSLFGTAIALILFNHLIKISSAIFAASVTYLMPIVAIFWGLADGERINFYDLLFSAIIISGVYLVNLKSKKHIK